MNFQDFYKYCNANFIIDKDNLISDTDSFALYYKRGSKIHIKKKNRGTFTKYCNGKVTNECIQRGKNSPDPKIRKRATFAQNARSWNNK